MVGSPWARLRQVAAGLQGRPGRWHRRARRRDDVACGVNLSEVEAAVGQAAGVVLDTNVALLLIAGTADPRRVGSKRLAAFDADDLVMAQRIAASARRLVTTPHLLTEISNLLGGWPEAQAALRTLTAGWEERWPQLASIGDEVEARVFERLGLADWAVTTLATDGVLVISTDIALCIAVEWLGGETVRFNQVRATE
jgi:hypothetical protein